MPTSKNKPTKRIKLTKTATGRAPNKTFLQDRDTPAEKRTYFKADHETVQPQLAFAKPYAEAGRVRVQYKITGEGRKIHVSPTALTSWLVTLSPDEQREEIKRWKDRVNGQERSLAKLYPEFFRKHERMFIKWLNQTAQVAMVDKYYTSLGKYVFPFFVGKCGEQNPTKWREYYPQFRKLLHESLRSRSSRNGVITALTRYQKFLMDEGGYREDSIPLMTRERKPKRAQKEGQVLPGELPHDVDVAAYLEGMPKGYFRWLLILEAAFGTRISEAFLATKQELIGKRSLEDETSRIIRALEKRYKVIAFLSVNKAEKLPLQNAEVAKVLGNPKKKPKSKDYYAVCTSPVLGRLVADAINNREHIRPEQYSFQNARNDIRKLPADNTPFKFSEWGHHDFRRYHMTELVLEWGHKGDVADSHGDSEEMVDFYHQYGLAMRRKEQDIPFELNL